VKDEIGMSMRLECNLDFFLDDLKSDVKNLETTGGIILRVAKAESKVRSCFM
jgi:hypothetical protein